MDNTIYIIESNSVGNGVRAIEHAQKQNYKVHFLTGTPDKYKNMKKNPLHISDSVTFIDTMDVSKLLHFFKDKSPVAILTFDDFHIIPTTIVANTMGVVSPNLNGVINCRFKDIARKKTKGIGKNVAYDVLDLEYEYVDSPIGYPCVVKPIDESGSVGVKVCYNAKEFQEACSSLKLLTQHPTGYNYIRKFLVEEFIEGEEYSGELVWNREKEEWEVIGFTKKLISDPPSCIEVGHIFPHYFSTYIEKEVVSIIKEWLKSLNIYNSLVHIEFKISNNEVALVEVNPRPAGGHINTLVEMTIGKDLISHYVDLCVKKKIRTNPPSKYGMVRFILPPKLGLLESINFSNNHTLGINQFYVNTNRKNIKTITNGDDRLGYAISIGHSPKHCKDSILNFVNSIEFVYSKQGDLNNEQAK